MAFLPQNSQEGCKKSPGKVHNPQEALSSVQVSGKSFSFTKSMVEKLNKITDGNIRNSPVQASPKVHSLPVGNAVPVGNAEDGLYTLSTRGRLDITDRPDKPARQASSSIDRGCELLAVTE